MRVLYAAYKYDPRDPDQGSSVDYECYNAILRAGFDTNLVAPATASLSAIERGEYWLWRKYTKATGKKNLKFPLTLAWKASRLLTRAVAQNKPDVVFSIFPPSFVFYRGKVPYVWYFDTTFIGLQNEWPVYGKLPLSISIWLEKKVLAKAARVITTSQWSKDILVNEYRMPPERIEIIPLAAAIPASVIPAAGDVLTDKRLESPLRLLLVGRVYERKGIDIAIEVVKRLNRQGVPAQLTVCGINEKPGDLPDFIQFVGPYQKDDPAQLREYVNWYKWAHILIHPARFEPAGIVPSEAAAFGTPTITNDAGGLATTVKDGISGIVLPKNSSPELYAQALIGLTQSPERYYSLCRAARERYDRELNWGATGNELARILNEVGSERAG
jgi:glycosyltransferase involved in cell wall biosynthesis